MVDPACVQFAQQIHDGFAIGGVQVTGRLIRQQDQRIAAQRARHGHALLLTARELRRDSASCGATSPRARAHPAPAACAPRRRHAAISQRQFHVLVDREIADQVECLEDEADLAVADARPLGKLQARSPAFRSDNRCRRWAYPAGPRMASRVDFAAAGRPRNRQVLPFLHIEVDPRKARASPLRR